MREILIVCGMLGLASCMTDYGRMDPPIGLWRHQSSSLLHGLAIEIDLYSDGSFSIRQSAGDSKTMTKRYELLASGTYRLEGSSVHFALSMPIKSRQGKDAMVTGLTGTIAESGRLLVVDYFGSQSVFTWRSP
jgi:hypothetical protein